VFFTTSQPLLNSDTDETSDLYEAEFEGTGVATKISHLTLVSQGGVGDSAPGHGADVLGILGFSRDGSRVYLAARGKLTSGANALGEEAQEGAPNLYLIEPATGATTFIATLSGADEEDWRPGNNERAQVTPDGRFLVFSSQAQLTPDDTSEGIKQLFEYDASSRSLARVSVGDRGYDNNGNTDADEPFLGESGEGRRSGSVVPNGAVFFTSTAALTPGATADPEHLRRNVYEYEAGRVFLIARGSGLNDEGGNPALSATRLWGVDASGENVFFSTLERLVPSDRDGRPDLYDARVGGGFPQPVSQPNCEAAASCQGAGTAPPAFGVPASATLLGAGNATPVLPAVAKPKLPTRAQHLAKALKSCRKDRNHAKRVKCEKAAHKLYGAKPKVRSRQGAK
jgi:hypothetical protein